MGNMRTNAPAGDDAPVLYSPAQVAERTGVSLASVYRWIQSGRLECVVIGGQYRIDAEALARYIEDCTRARLNRHPDVEEAVTLR
jgi:excisionase family DNA binding protein